MGRFLEPTGETLGYSIQRLSEEARRADCFDNADVTCWPISALAARRRSLPWPEFSLVLGPENPEIHFSISIIPGVCLN